MIFYRSPRTCATCILTVRSSSRRPSPQSTVSSTRPFHPKYRWTSLKRWLIKQWTESWKPRLTFSERLRWVGALPFRYISFNFSRNMILPSQDFGLKQFYSGSRRFTNYVIFQLHRYLESNLVTSGIFPYRNSTMMTQIVRIKTITYYKQKITSHHSSLL